MTNMYPPWGSCNPEASLKYTVGSYSRDMCYQECLIDKLIKQCGCAPYYVLQSAELNGVQVCDTAKYVGCIVPYTGWW